MLKSMMPNPVVICFVNLAEPTSLEGGSTKFSVSVLICKDDLVNKKWIDDQVAIALAKGKEKYWKGKVPPNLFILGKTPGQVMRDGDAEQKENGGIVGPEYKGCWFFTASANAGTPHRLTLKQAEEANATTQEPIIWPGQPILLRCIPTAERNGGPAVEEVDPSIFHSGCTVKIDLNIFARNQPSKGIGAQLNGLIFIKDGIRSVGGATDADEDDLFE